MLPVYIILTILVAIQILIGLIGFGFDVVWIFEICTRAARSYMTPGSGLASAIGSAIYPVWSLIELWRDDGWIGVREHWKVRARRSIVIAFVWTATLFSYHFFYVVPHGIYSEYASIRAPLVAPMLPAQSAQPRTVPPITTVEFITTSLTIDRAKPSIRQWRYSSDNERITVEVNASDWLAANNVKLFEKDRDELTRDLVLFSLASFLRSVGAQLWEIHPHLIGSLLRFHPEPNRTCRIITEIDMRRGLQRSHNLFASAPMWTLCCQTVCLPSGSSFYLFADSLVIGNGSYNISFRVEGPTGVNYVNPGKGEELAKLANGEAQFETRAVGLDVTVDYFPNTMSDSEFMKYKEWASGLVKAAKQWFEN